MMMTLVSKGIIFITMCFMLLGAFDYLQNNKWGYGESFAEGLNTCGPFILGAAVIIAIAPDLANALVPYIQPMASFFHLDASIFPALFLCSDMGGYAIGSALSDSEAMGLFNGLVVSSIIGATFTFIIPMALAILPPKDLKILSSGVLTGTLGAPAGCLAGGILMHFTKYSIPFMDILYDLIPVLILSFLIAFLLIAFPKQTIRIFGLFGKGISILITILTVLTIFQQVTGIIFPFIGYPATAQGTYSPFQEAFVTVGSIAIVLSGAFPMVKWLLKVLHQPLGKLEELLKTNSQSIEGLLAASTNHIAGLNCFKMMDSKGKYLTMSFMICGGCFIGDLLGFVAGINPDLLIPMMIGKLSGGIVSLILAEKLYSHLNL